MTRRMGRQKKSLAERVMTLEQRVKVLESHVPDKAFIEEEFKFLREQAQLTNRALDVLLAAAKLDEERHEQHEKMIDGAQSKK